MTVAIMLGLALIACAYLFVVWCARDRAAVEADNDAAAKWFEKVRATPEPTWDRRHDPRDRLRHVEPRRPVRIPVQRDGSGH